MARPLLDSKDTKKQNMRSRQTKKSSSIVNTILKEPQSELPKSVTPAKPSNPNLKLSKKEKNGSARSSNSRPPTSGEAKKLVHDDPDFINLKRFDYSLKKLVERYPDGCPARIIAHALFIPESEVEKIYNQIIQKLKKEMGISE